MFILLSIFDHPRSGVVYNFGPVCLSVCLETMTFESLDVGSSLFAHPVYLAEYGSSSYIKVIRSRSRLQEQSLFRKSLFPLCKTSIGRNSGSIKPGKCTGVVTEKPTKFRLDTCKVSRLAFVEVTLQLHRVPEKN